jgi:hypothetical protein
MVFNLAIQLASLIFIGFSGLFVLVSRMEIFPVFLIEDLWIVILSLSFLLVYST